MSEKKTEFDYVLETPFGYAYQGGQQEASFVQLRAPSSRNSRDCAALKQAFWRTVDPDREGKENADASEKITGEDVMMMLAMSKDVDLPDVIDVACRLFTKGKVAFVDGETPLTKPLLENMMQDDLEAMVGEYLVNFTLASSLAQMEKKSSKG